MAQALANDSRFMVISPPASLLEVDEVCVFRNAKKLVLISQHATSSNDSMYVTTLADPDGFDLGLRSISSLLGTASITSSVTQWEWENGRRYHAYKAGSYAFPNDEVWRRITFTNASAICGFDTAPLCTICVSNCADRMSNHRKNWTESTLNII